MQQRFMKTHFILAFMLCVLALPAIGQQRIDGNFAFQTDPAKKYSIYVPSTYVQGTPHRLMLALHPLNTNRWDGESWCDTLIDFAEMNQLLLVSPDGGADGAIDDAIDTAFTSALLDSMETWYTVDAGKIYAMGFSWGARTTYTYGLSNSNRIAGYLPVGAAINGTSEVNEPLQVNAAGKPVYIVHGSLDNPNSRFYPVRDSLLAKGAILNSILLSNVGHTIDFTNRNQILSTAYAWIDSVNCSTVGIDPYASAVLDAIMYPNILSSRSAMSVTIALEVEKAETASIEVYSINGQLQETLNLPLQPNTNRYTLSLNQLPVGSYFLRMATANGNAVFKFIIE